MAGLTADTHAISYGVAGTLTSWPVGATQQLYSGEVALISGGSGGITKGYLKNAAVAFASDIVVGMLDEPAGGTYVSTGAGVLGGATDGAVWLDVKSGAFFFQSGSGADQLSASTNGTNVYYGGENASGPIAMATSAGGTRPTLGV